MTTYDHSELGIASAQGNTVFLAVICLFVAVIHIVQHHQQSEKYPRILIRLTMIILAPALLSICCLFGMFWRSVLIDLFVQIVKALTIASFIGYLFAFLGAKPVNNVLVYDHDCMINHIMDMGKIRHLACFAKCFGSIDVSTPEKAESYRKRVRIAVWQYVVILPILVVIAVAVYFINDDIDTFSLWFQVLSSISTLIAMYNFKLASDAISKIDAFKSFNVTTKALSIQLGIMLPQLQGTFIGIFVGRGLVIDDDDYSYDQIQYFIYYQLLAAEMIVVSFVFILVFKPSDFEDLARMNNADDMEYHVAPFPDDKSSTN